MYKHLNKEVLQSLLITFQLEIAEIEINKLTESENHRITNETKSYQCIHVKIGCNVIE